MKIVAEGRRAIVTGAGQGIGQSISMALCKAGAQVVGVDVDTEALETLNRNGITTAKIDVTDARTLDAFVKNSGNFDIAIHVAGGVLGQVGQLVETVLPEEWASIVDVNQSAVFYLARSVVPAMKEKKWGRIVTISSRAGLEVSLTGIQAYASAKAGQIGLVRQLGHELGQFGITVNSVAPGFVRSNPTTEKQWSALGSKRQKELIENIAMRRLGDPDDIAAAVLFLASDQASWITGQVLSVDGGR